MKSRNTDALCDSGRDDVGLVRRPINLGRVVPRVPLLIILPHSKTGFTSHTQDEARPRG